MIKWKYRFAVAVDIRTRNFFVYATEENGGGYYVEVHDRHDRDWKDVGLIFHHFNEVINYVHRWYGWREAAQLKKAIRLACF